MVSFLRKEVVGLDISDHTIEAVELVEKSGKPSVAKLGRINLEPDVVSNGKILDKKKLAIHIKRLFAEAKPKPIESKDLILGIPENKTYTTIFSLGEHNEEERDKLVEEEVRLSIPISYENLIYKYQTLSESKENTEILVIAVSREFLEEWNSFFNLLGMDVEGFDPENLATFRSLFNRVPSTPVCVVDMGSRTSSVSIFDGKGLQHSYSSLIAGNYLKEQLENNQTGKTELDLLNPFFAELETTLRYFENNTSKKVGQIILVGGLSKLQGLVQHIEQRLNIKTQLGQSVLLNKKVPLEYLGAIGIALRSLQKKWSAKDIIFDSEQIDEKKKQVKKMASEPKFKEVKDDEPAQSKSNTSGGGKGMSKTKKQLIILLVIVILGVGLIVSLLMYRNSQREERVQNIENTTISFEATQTFPVQIPLSIDDDEDASDRVAGRTIVDTIEDYENYEQAERRALVIARRELDNGEYLWEIPFSNYEEESGDPIEFTWVVFNLREAQTMFLNKVADEYLGGREHALNNVLITNIIRTSNPNVLSLEADVVIALNELVNLENQEAVDDTEILENDDVEDTNVEDIIEVQDENIQEVLILDTGFGFLNVRSGPGTNFEKVAEVSPGESYPLLEEEGSWFKISISDEINGWVINTYAEKK